MLKITVLRPSELTSHHLEVWRRILREDGLLNSPFLRPEFVCAVGAVRNDVEIGVLTDGSEVTGFFPFQRHARHSAGPVGWKLSDLQAVVARKGCVWSPAQLLRSCHLRSWHFSNLIATQSEFQPCHSSVAESPYMDLSCGFEGYATACRARGSSYIVQTQRKRRRMEREAGPLRFEFDVSDPGVLQRLLQWKSEQYQRTNILDMFRFQWAVRLMERIAEAPQEDGFRGVLSALYCGDELVAAHLGMRSDDVLHWWMPGYSQAHSGYSPGSILMLQLTQTAAAQDIRRIDLGSGDERYKASVMSGFVGVAEGAAGVNSVQAACHRILYQARSLSRSSRLRWLMRLPKTVLRQLRYRKG